MAFSFTETKSFKRIINARKKGLAIINNYIIENGISEDDHQWSMENLIAYFERKGALKVLNSRNPQAIADYVIDTHHAF